MRCRGLLGLANAAYLSDFLCCVLHHIAFPVVSEWCQDERQEQSDSRSNGTHPRPSEPQSADMLF